MPDVLSQYYRGVTRQLRGEVDFINALFAHQGLKGEGNETALRDLVTRFIPARYSVGTGVVIDRHGTTSRQCDVIVYDRVHYPSLLSLRTVHLFPVDLVYATVEVKTTLTSSSASDALTNIASVRALEFVPDQYMLLESRVATPEFSNGPHIAGIVHTPTPPMGVVFAYNCEAKGFETFKSWFDPCGKEPTLYPTLVATLDQGLLKFQDVSPGPGLVLEGFAIPLLDKNSNPIRPPKEAVDSAIVEGEQYPIKTVHGQRVLIDQSRILLMFLLLLSEMLSFKTINPNIRFTQHYLSRLHRGNLVV